MARRVAKSSLNGSTIEILNVIRANASQAYQDSVPEVTNGSSFASKLQFIESASYTFLGLPRRAFNKLSYKLQRGGYDGFW